MQRMHNPDTAGARIGIITGSGPEAGLDLWSKILQANRALLGDDFRGDLDAPHVTIFSEPALGLSMELAQNDEVLWDCMKSAAYPIAQRVDYYAIACNTLNYYQPQLEALNLPAKLISFADVALEFIQVNRIERIALLGAQPVTDLGAWSHYRALATQVEIEQIEPALSEQLHRLIYDVKAIGADGPDIRGRLAAIIDALASDTVLLACTELPLIAPSPTPKHIVDVTDLVAHKLARLAQRQS